jgi:hypothetical protein
MKHLNLAEVTRTRIAKWILNTKPVNPDETWIEKRLAINVNGAIYILGNGQVFQCPRCGNYDPEWSAQEVIAYFQEHMGIKPYEIEVACSIAPVAKDE